MTDVTQKDLRFWNELAERYSRRPVENPDAFERKITATLSRVRPQDIVLDIGCGTGSLALRLAPSCNRVHGLDLSSEMIRIANGKAVAQGTKNVTFHTGPFDASFTVFDDESFDGILAFSLLHLVDDRPAALAHVYRLLKPGGFFISSTVCLGGSWVPYGLLLRVMRWLGKAPRVKIISQQKLQDEIGRAGFVDISRPDVGAKRDIAFLVAARPR